MSSRNDLLRKRLDEGWRCATCQAEHRGIMDIGSPAPGYWTQGGAPEPNSALRMDCDFLGEDLCVIGGRDFFVRGVMEIPVHGLDESFGIGCWSTLSRKNFEAYVESWDEPSVGLSWPGWYSTWLAPYPTTINQPCRVESRQKGMRPAISLASHEHPMAIDQRKGISIERLFEIYRANGHVPDREPR